MWILDCFVLVEVRCSVDIRYKLYWLESITAMVAIMLRVCAMVPEATKRGMPETGRLWRQVHYHADWISEMCPENSGGLFRW